MDYKDIREAKPIGTQCVRCEGQANVLIEGWTLDGPAEKSQWTCPRCDAANAIMVPGKVVGVAIGTGQVVSGGRLKDVCRADKRSDPSPRSFQERHWAAIER